MVRILVIDDDSGVRGVLSLILERAGYTVFAASHGRAGLDVLAKERIDLVIADVEMPGLTGFEVCRSIKSDAKLSLIPVIIMTGRPSDDSKERALKEGAITLLAKPFDRRTLLEGIPVWIGQPGREEK